MASPEQPEDPNPPYGDPGAPQNEFDAEGQNEELETGVPEVAASPRRVMIIMLAIIGGIGFLIYFLFFGDEKPAEESEKPKTEVTQTPEIPIAPPPIQPIQPPAPPELAPVPDPVPPPPSPESAAPPVNDQEKLARLRSGMLIVDAQTKAADTSGRTKAESALAGSDPNTAFSQNAIKASDAEEAKATTMGNMNTLIAQGKIVDAVLETAINTDLPGTLRAIVSRDIFAESGRLALIPKGSRLIGNYNTGILRGQKRVFIVWTRVIRPDGIDIAIGSPGIDMLGRAGVAGEVDNKYAEMFSAAALTSAIAIGAAIGGDKALGEDNQITTTTNAAGGTTQTGSAGAFAVADAVDNISSVGKTVVQSILDSRPTITIDQGTRVNVFVNRDLIFPSSVLQQKFVP